MNTRKLSFATTAFGLSSLFAVLALVCGNASYGSAIDLGAADDFSVLTYNSNNSSSDAFNGAPIGVVNGNWVQSGGDDQQQNNTVILSSTSFKNNGNPGNGIVESTVYNAALLNTAWADAQAASASLAAMAPTQTYGAISTSQTITGTAGTNVINISSINLNQAALTLSGPASATFVLNISGNITLNGGSQGNGLLLAGGLAASNVIYNLTGASSTLTTTGGGNAQQIYGTVLATGTNALVHLSPGGVNGEIIATNFQSSSNASVTVLSPIPEVSAFLPLGLVMGAVVGANCLRRKRSADLPEDLSSAQI